MQDDVTLEELIEQFTASWTARIQRRFPDGVIPYDEAVRIFRLVDWDREARLWFEPDELDRYAAETRLIDAAFDAAAAAIETARHEHKARIFVSIDSTEGEP